MRDDIETLHDLDALESRMEAEGKLTAIPGREDRSIRRVEDVPSVFTFANETRAFTVEGWLPQASLVLLTSESGQGKTMLALNVAVSVAEGVPFCGRATSRQSVLYLDRENPAHVIAERLRRFGVAESERLRIWGCWCADEPPKADSQIVIEWVLACDPKPLVIVDSLIAFHPGAENDSADTRRYMHGFRRLTSAGATVVVLHHSGKADTSKDYRGSSDIKAAVDCGYHLANIGDPSRLELIRLRAFKTRFPVETELLLNFGATGFCASEEARKPSVTESLIDLLVAHPGIGTSEFQKLAVEQGLGRDRARQFLNGNARSGRVVIQTGDRNARYHTWKGDDA